jgi:hypothetical protein
MNGIIDPTIRIMRNSLRTLNETKLYAGQTTSFEMNLNKSTDYWVLEMRMYRECLAHHQFFLTSETAQPMGEDESAQECGCGGDDAGGGRQTSTQKLQTIEKCLLHTSPLLNCCKHLSSSLQGEKQLS